MRIGSTSDFDPGIVLRPEAVERGLEFAALKVAEFVAGPGTPHVTEAIGTVGRPVRAGVPFVVDAGEEHADG